MNHSILSPSKAERWLNCLSSVKYTNITESADAMNGRTAHALAEKILKGGYNNSLIFPSNTMKESIAKYIQFIWPIALASDAWGVEKYIDIESIMGGGTCDFWAIEGNILHIADFKYGVGRIKAEDNPQLKLYAYGLMEELNTPILEVRMYIIQPRCNKKGVFEKFIMSGADLFTWVKNVVQPAVQAIYTNKEKYCTGHWCWFCSGKKVCPEVMARKAKKDYIGGNNMDGRFTTEKPLRCVYVALKDKVPAIAGSDNLEYQLSILIPQDDSETLELLQTAFVEASNKGTDIWDGKKPSEGKGTFQNLVKCPGDDDPEWKKGHYILKLKSIKESIPCYSGNMEPCKPETIKNGDYVRVCGTFAPYNNKQFGARGISVYLNSVLYISQGERIICGGDQDPMDDFFPNGIDKNPI